MSPYKEAPIDIDLADDFSGTVELKGYSGKLFDKTRTYVGGKVQLGQTLNESGLFDLIITDLTSGKSIKTKLILDSRYPTKGLSVLQTTIYLPTLPYTVKLSDFATVFKIKLDGNWETITMPGYITFNEYASFEAEYYKDGIWRQAIVRTSPIDTSFKNIC